MVQIDVCYEGELSCRATHGPSGTELVTDAPVDNHGRGLSFSPTDLVATALGTCILTILAIAAEKRGRDVRGSTARVTKRMASAPKRRIAALEVELRVAGSHDAAARRALEAAALACPVHGSLGHDVELPVRVVWEEDGEAAGERLEG